MGLYLSFVMFCITANMVNSSLVPHEKFVEFLKLSMQGQETRDLGTMIVQQGYN